MNRNDVLEVVLRHLAANVEGVDPEAIDATRSMGDYGATSIDMLEVAVASGREMNVRVPRTRLAKCKNLDDLVDLFLAFSVENASG